MLLIAVQEYIKRIPHLNCVSGVVVHVIKGTEEFDDYLEKEMFKDFYSRDHKEKMVLWNNGMIDEEVIEILEKCKKWCTKRNLGNIKF